MWIAAGQGVWGRATNGSLGTISALACNRFGNEVIKSLGTIPASMQTKGATTIFPCYKQCLAVCLCGRQGHRQLGAAAGRCRTIQRHAQNLASNCSPQLGLCQLTERPIALLLSPSAVTIPQVFPLRASFAWRRVAVATLHSSACTRVTVPCYRRSLLHTSPLPEAGGRNRHVSEVADHSDLGFDSSISPSLSLHSCEQPMTSG